MMNFKVKVQCGDNTFVSWVYKIDREYFLLYDPDAGFGWYSIYAQDVKITLEGVIA